MAEISDLISKESSKLHFFRAREIAKIRAEGWKGVKEYLVNYVLQEWEIAMAEIATIIYEKYPKIGELYDKFNPIP